MSVMQFTKMVPAALIPTLNIQNRKSIIFGLQAGLFSESPFPLVVDYWIFSPLGLLGDVLFSYKGRRLKNIGEIPKLW